MGWLYMGVYRVYIKIKQFMKDRIFLTYNGPVAFD